MKKALITGVTGQDGAYLSKLLLKKGYEVHGSCRHSAAPNFWRLDELGIVKNMMGSTIFNANFLSVTLDITCPHAVASVIIEGQYDEVYNLAAMSFVKESFNSPAATFEISAKGVLNLLEAIRLHSPHTKFYQASTSEMFGLVNVEAQDENTPFHPRSPYGVAKAAAHYLVQNYREAYDLHASSGILFNHESPLRGEEFVTRKITKGIAEIVAGKRNKISLGNLDIVRDWGHAEDYVRAMWLMLQQKKAGDYVIATGEPHSLGYFLYKAFKVAGIDNYMDYVLQDPKYIRPSDVPALCGNADRAYVLMNWQPKYTFEEMVEEMVNADLKRLEIKTPVCKIGGIANVS